MLFRIFLKAVLKAWLKATYTQTLTMEESQART